MGGNGSQGVHEEGARGGKRPHKDSLSRLLLVAQKLNSAGPRQPPKKHPEGLLGLSVQRVRTWAFTYLLGSSFVWVTRGH